jgi:hypothetical protein
MIAFRFQNGMLEGVLRYREDLLMGVCADLEIVIDGRVLLREQDFPIVELRTALAAWLREGLMNGTDFVHESVEHDEPGLVWIRRSPDGPGWRIGSIWQEQVENRTWSDTEIHAAVRNFVETVDQWVAAEFGVDVDSYLSETRK